MKKLILILAIIISANISFSQNYIYNGDSKYESTPNWKFYIKDYFWPQKELEVCVAKNDKNGGYIFLTVEVPNRTDSIHDTLTIVLSDSSKIISRDQNTRHFEAGKSMALYELTTGDISKLKSINIYKILFSVNGGEEKEYTALNISEYAYSKGLRFTSNQTASYVAKLFGK